MKLLVALALFLALGSQLALSQDRSVTGRVVDMEGKPVANASVSKFWRANGSARKPDGTAFDLQDKAQLHEFWGRLGHFRIGQSVVVDRNPCLEVKEDSVPHRTRQYVQNLGTIRYPWARNCSAHRS